MKRTGVIHALVCVWYIICRHKLELLKVAEDVLINKLNGMLQVALLSIQLSV